MKVLGRFRRRTVETKQMSKREDNVEQTPFRVEEKARENPLGENERLRAVPEGRAPTSREHQKELVGRQE